MRNITHISSKAINKTVLYMAVWSTFNRNINSVV